MPLPPQLTLPSLDHFLFQCRTLPPEGSLKVSGYAKGTAGRVLTAGVIEQHDVVQGDVALPLLGNGCLKDDLRRTKGQVKELINEGEGPEGVEKSSGFLQFARIAWKVDTLMIKNTHILS